MKIKQNSQIEALETKVQKEMEDLKEKLAKMPQEMDEFSDLDGLKARADERRRQLAQEKEQLETKKISITQSLQEINTAVSTLKVKNTAINVTVLLKQKSYLSLIDLHQLELIITFTKLIVV